MSGGNRKFTGFLKSHMWEEVVRANMDGLQHCCEYISKACVGSTACMLCALAEDMCYSIETLSERDGQHIEQSCRFL
jgi:hypothetical protein